MAHRKSQPQREHVIPIGMDRSIEDRKKRYAKALFDMVILGRENANNHPATFNLGKFRDLLDCFVGDEFMELVIASDLCNEDKLFFNNATGSMRMGRDQLLSMLEQPQMPLLLGLLMQLLDIAKAVMEELEVEVE